LPPCSRCTGNFVGRFVGSRRKFILQKKEKILEITEISRIFLELLGRFELPTSSLPIMHGLFQPVAACRGLLRKVIAPQGKRDFAFCFLLLLVVACNLPFFGAGMGFVWFFPKPIPRDLIPYLRPS